MKRKKDKDFQDGNARKKQGSPEAHNVYVKSLKKRVLRSLGAKKWEERGKKRKTLKESPAIRYLSPSFLRKTSSVFALPLPPSSTNSFVLFRLPFLFPLSRENSFREELEIRFVHFRILSASEFRRKKKQGRKTVALRKKPAFFLLFF